MLAPVKGRSLRERSASGRLGAADEAGDYFGGVECGRGSLGESGQAAVAARGCDEFGARDADGAEGGGSLRLSRANLGQDEAGVAIEGLDNIVPVLWVLAYRRQVAGGGGFLALSGGMGHTIKFMRTHSQAPVYSKMGSFHTRLASAACSVCFKAAMHGSRGRDRERRR